jgi:hypothetical protein
MASAATGTTDDLNNHQLLKLPAVQAYLNEVAGARTIIFVNGCARSGTSLIQRCLSTVRDPVYYWSENALSQIYRQRRIGADGAHIVLKRTGYCHRHVHAIPAAIKIVHIVRHPAFTLTSRVRHRPGFYVPPERFRDEYAAYRHLRQHHPSANMTVVRYEDLVQEPDRTQDAIGRALGLIFDLRFSRYCERDYLDLKIEPDTGEKRRWEPIDAERAHRTRPGTAHLEHWHGLLRTIGPEIESFCRDFGYAVDPT